MWVGTNTGRPQLSFSHLPLVLAPFRVYVHQGASSVTRQDAILELLA